jgi:hypothetical protein
METLGPSVGGVTHWHNAHRAPVLFTTIMTIPQRTAFSSLVKGHDGEHP